jgi:hypothetical protein
MNAIYMSHYNPSILNPVSQKSKHATATAGGKKNVPINNTSSVLLIHFITEELHRGDVIAMF